jgi:hypothetical protein
MQHMVYSIGATYAYLHCLPVLNTCPYLSFAVSLIYLLLFKPHTPIPLPPLAHLLLIPPNHDLHNILCSPHKQSPLISCPPNPAIHAAHHLPGSPSRSSAYTNDNPAFCKPERASLPNSGAGEYILSSRPLISNKPILWQNSHLEGNLKGIWGMSVRACVMNAGKLDEDRPMAHEGKRGCIISQ